MRGVRVTSGRIRWLVVLAGVLLASLVPASAGAIVPILVINTDDSGPGSLRAAIELSNTTPGADTIAFAIPTTDLGFTGERFRIKPLSDLPTLSDDGTTIDGSTQTTFGGDTNPAGPEIELNGDLAPADSTGFNVASDDNRIDSLAVTGFGAGIAIWGERNVVERSQISENTGTGISIRFDFSGNIGRENAIIGNLILGNGGPGVDLTGADDNVIQGNRIEENGFNTGLLGCAAGCGGIVIGGGSPLPLLADGNLIGGSAPGEGNVISGGGNAGIEMREFVGSGTTIQGNLIGTNASGNAAFGNKFLGILVAGTNTLVGGTAPGARNVISGNGGGGIGIGGDDAVISGNYIGTDAAGMDALPNGLDGVSIGGVSSALVVDNIISASSGNGVSVSNGATGVVIRNNLIGTNVTGTADLGNGGHGIQSRPGPNPIADNTILVEGNWIVHNDLDGARVTGNATSMHIGGATAGAGNVISDNGGFGVLLVGRGGNHVEGNTIADNVRAGIFVFSGVGNAIGRNSILGNGELGIDLAPLGVNPNDPGDADAGANNLRNYPVLTDAVATPFGLRVRGTIDTPNPETVLIEFFANPVPSPGGDPSGHGEGADFLGTVTPNPDGSFVVSLPGVPAGTLISATATDTAGNTSEFAANIAAKGAPAVPGPPQPPGPPNGPPGPPGGP